MNDAELRDTVLRLLSGVAPEIDPGAVDPDAGFRDQFDLDSMDFQNFVIAIDRELQVAIPERDYEQLSSLTTCVQYLRTRLAGR
jgi:acyl carrier protein